MRAGACAVQAARARRPYADRRRGRMDPRTGRTLSTNRNGRLAMLHIARLIEHRFPNLLLKHAKVPVAASALIAALGIPRAITRVSRPAPATDLPAGTVPHQPTNITHCPLRPTARRH